MPYWLDRGQKLPQPAKTPAGLAPARLEQEAAGLMERTGQYTYYGFRKVPPRKLLRRLRFRALTSPAPSTRGLFSARAANRLAKAGARGSPAGVNAN
jgi:hypothetical protein